MWSTERVLTFIEAGNALCYFISFIWILGPIFWSEISKSLFVILTKFLNPEPSFYMYLPENFVMCWSPSLEDKSPLPQMFRTFWQFLSSHYINI